MRLIFTLFSFLTEASLDCGRFTVCCRGHVSKQNAELETETKDWTCEVVELTCSGVKTFRPTDSVVIITFKLLLVTSGCCETKTKGEEKEIPVRNKSFDIHVSEESRVWEKRGRGRSQWKCVVRNNTCSTGPLSLITRASSQQRIGNKVSRIKPTRKQFVNTFACKRHSIHQ